MTTVRDRVHTELAQSSLDSDVQLFVEAAVDGIHDAVLEEGAPADQAALG